MTIALRSFDALDVANVQQNRDEILARVTEWDPTMDMRWGPFNNLIAYLSALLAEQNNANIADYLSARSLLDIQADPTLADNATVDGVLSNFGVLRKSGSLARGEVVIVVSAPTTITLAVGSVFQAKGKTFHTERVYTAKREPEQILTASDRLLSPLGDGNYAFTVSVVADEEGSASKLTKDALIVPQVTPSNYVRSNAASDFTGGLDAESNQDLLEKLQAGIACKAPSNTVNMAAMLRQIDAYSRVVGMSIVGYGDPEMARDRHWIFPVSGGGKVDWYIRTTEAVTRLAVRKTCTCVAVDTVEQTSTWQVSLARNDAPGFYEVAGVRPVASVGVAGGFQITSDIRAVDLSGSGFRPDVANAVEGAYTRYQTAVFQFLDTSTAVDGLTVGATGSYDLDVRVLNLIGDIQDTMATATTRSRSSDVLIKAPVPCFVSVNFQIVKRNGAADPDLDAIKAAVVREVNTTGFTGVLYASGITRVVGDLLADDARTTGIDLLGRIRYPDGYVRRIRSGDHLVVPSDPARFVSPRTVQFFADPEDVGITMVTAAPSN